jgi:hypothetical protein
MVKIADYSPRSTPWDYYGMKQVQKWEAIMEEAKIETVSRTINRRLLSPYPSGPNGTLRFGDDMMPGTYELWIKREDWDAAESALELHQKRVKAWLDGKTSMPKNCKPAC